MQACNFRSKKEFEEGDEEILMGFATLASMAVRDSAILEDAETSKGAINRALETIAQMEDPME